MPIEARVAAWPCRTALLATCVILGMSAAAATAAPARDLPLIDAARAADADAVRALLERRVDVNTAETDGTTALHWAAYKGDLETARMLLGAGADVGAANRYGVTPLALAAGRGIPAIVEALLDAGADPNTTLPEGETVLMTTSRPRGAANRYGVTPLALAAGRGIPAIVEALLDAGAHRQRRRVAAAPGARCRPPRTGELARTDGAALGRGRESPRRRPHAHRARG